MIEYLVRFVQAHTSFRKPELEALAALEGIEMEIVEYSEESPFCIVRLPNDQAAKRLLSRSLLCMGIYEFWGRGTSYPTLHAHVKALTTSLWPLYKTVSFRFFFDTYQGRRSTTSQRELIESFRYMGFDGPIIMKNADVVFTIFEEYPSVSEGRRLKNEGVEEIKPERLFMGRYVGGSARELGGVYDLKKRKYISTTSMDAELALITANLAHARPGSIFFDPFSGTGGFPIACAHFGAMTLGADLDGRMLRGKGDKNVIGNFIQYGLMDRYLDGFVADLTNSPLRGGREKERKGGWLDGIVCDPPYGIREGLKVLGRKEGTPDEPVKLANGSWAHLREDFVPPKKPYSFEALLDDILEFAAIMLVENGRLSMWMPTANDEEIEFAIPSHDWLEIVSVCVQPFSKWSRRLLTYRRRNENEIDRSVERKKREYGTGKNADELNNFRKKYFEGFQEQKTESTTSLDKSG